MNTLGCLDQRVVVVTGASEGLGVAFARAVWTSPLLVTHSCPAAGSTVDLDEVPRHLANR